MGLGMGSTMMPVFTAALASLKDHDIARGSTLMNITQQIAISMGTALFSVLLTNAYNDHAAVGRRRRWPSRTARLPISSGLSADPGHRPCSVSQGLHFMGQSFGGVFLVADGAGRAVPGPGVLPAAQAAGAPRRRGRVMVAMMG